MLKPATRRNVVDVSQADKAEMKRLATASLKYLEWFQVHCRNQG